MDTGFRDTGFGRDTGGTTGYGCTGVAFPLLSGAILRAERA